MFGRLPLIWKRHLVFLRVYNFGSENDLCTCDVVRHMLKLKNISGVSVVEDRESFADKHRNLRMDLSKIRESGINFLSTAEGLKEALSHNASRL